MTGLLVKGGSRLALCPTAAAVAVVASAHTGSRRSRLGLAGAGGRHGAAIEVEGCRSGGAGRCNDGGGSGTATCRRGGRRGQRAAAMSERRDETERRRRKEVWGARWGGAGLLTGHRRWRGGGRVMRGARRHGLRARAAACRGRVDREGSAPLLAFVARAQEIMERGTNGLGLGGCGPYSGPSGPTTVG